MVTVIVDDFDAAIAYTGTWKAQSTKGASNEYNKTSHGTSNPGVGFQLWFKGSASHCIVLAPLLSYHEKTGSSVTVFGTVPAQVTDSIQSSYSVDGAFAANFSSWTRAEATPEYQQVFFTSEELGFGWHVVAATVESAGEGFGYWFDYLTYKIPPPPAMHGMLPPSTHEIPPAAVPSTKGNTPAALIVVPSAVLSVTLFLVLVWRFWRRDWQSYCRICHAKICSYVSSVCGFRRVQSSADEITPYVVDLASPPAPQKPALAVRSFQRNAGSRLATGRRRG